MSSRPSRKKELYQARQRLLAEFFGGKCSKCGYNKCVAALHLHHTDPARKTRKFNARTWSVKDMDQAFFDELRTCIILCANCHAELHYAQNEVIDGNI